ncbi:MAG: pyridoxal 5'-phosphate synthase glutaminase subunit PdxT [Alphaproteobacteria bacterium]|nr:pyridoxal 5'-phosphate synthase glutaminase subunit PdxT [Alphaproteobacteria bacterium]
MKKPLIGVLALQGAVQPHKPHIEAAGGEFRAVKTPVQFDEVDGFILPGGESTTMLKLIDNFGLWDSLARNFAEKPVWGICAGCILIAEKVSNPAQKSFGLLPISVERNAYGRQLESHQVEITGYPVSFIRAPVITNTGEGVEVLATHDGDPVWVKKGQAMASTFHAELTLDFPSPMHRAFVEMVKKRA